MRLLQLVLPALALADQNPLFDQAKGWFDKAKSYIPSNLNPIDAGASVVTAKNVEKINIRNYERKLAPKLDQEEEWMIYLTGGNKSCFGRCGLSDTVWNQSVPLLLAQSASTPKLRLGHLDCDKDEVLCTAISAGVPAIHHYLIPSTQSTPSPKHQLHIIPLNVTTVSISDITSIPSSSQSTYSHVEEYTGAFHPFDGFMAQFGLLKPLGYLLWILGNVPSWAFMILISFVSRNIMSRRMTGGPAGGPPVGPAGGTAPAPAAAAPPASPNRAAAGGKKKK